MGQPAGEHLYWKHHATDMVVSPADTFVFITGTVTIYSYHYECVY